jgi:putative transposase
MGRDIRQAPGGVLFHVLNRAVDRNQIFFSANDYAAFEELMAETKTRNPMRICAYCLMPNHWHLALWPEEDGQLQPFMKSLTGVHALRWQKYWDLVGTGHLYQARYKSFPIQTEEYCLNAFRYIEANALRAGLVSDALLWRWSSLWRRTLGTTAEREILSDWPIQTPNNWVALVNSVQPKEELIALRHSATRGSPYGRPDWVEEASCSLQLDSSLRPRGRPSNNRKGA